MKVREYKIMEEAVERGIMWGWQHAHKHVDNPGEEAIKEHLLHDIMNEICERFVFEEASATMPHWSTVLKDENGEEAYWCNTCGRYVYSNPHECTPGRFWP